MRNPSAAPVRIRSYAPSDHGRVVSLWRRAGIEIGPSDTRAELERSRRRDPGLYLVAELQGRLVGVVLGRFDGRRGWINHLAVDPSEQRKGVGRALVVELERRLRAKGCPKLNLHVLPENERVAAFYDRLGYARREIRFFEKWL